MDKFARVNNINLHYLDFPGGEPPLVLLPGLTANAHMFDGLIEAGLSPRFRVLAIDMRGRGLSDKPSSGYSMNEHAADVIALLDELGLQEVVLCGHSFGGLMGYYMGAQYPQRISKLIIMDASILMITERTRQMIKASLDRLEQTMPSMEAYIEAMKKLPYLDGKWDDALESYYSSDVQVNEDSTVRPLATPGAIGETIDQEFTEPWEEYVAAIEQPTLLVNATGPFGPPGTPALMPYEMAQETAASLAHCKYVQVPGNHITMIFGENTSHVVKAITDFVTENSSTRE